VLDVKSPPFAVIATDSVVFWERGRIVFNLGLALAVMVLLGPPLRADYPWLELALLALGANVLYCAGYLPDFVLQHTPWRAVWRHVRWAVLAVGCLISVWIALAIVFAMVADFGFDPV
jgi:hypothetical protein